MDYHGIVSAHKYFYVVEIDLDDPTLNQRAGITVVEARRTKEFPLGVDIYTVNIQVVDAENDFNFEDLIHDAVAVGYLSTGYREVDWDCIHAGMDRSFNHPLASFSDGMRYAACAVILEIAKNPGSPDPRSVAEFARKEAQFDRLFGRYGHSYEDFLRVAEEVIPGQGVAAKALQIAFAANGAYWETVSAGLRGMARGIVSLSKKDST